jgi:hypothetical protein
MQKMDNKSGNGSANLEKYRSCLSKLINSFEIRFSNFQEDKTDKYFTNPFTISIVDFVYYPVEIQTEILNLQNKSTLQSKHKEATGQDLLSFWKFLPSSNFPDLHNLAFQYSCKFASIYICKQAFSIMNIIKMKFQSKFTDDCLKNLMLLGTKY